MRNSVSPREAYLRTRDVYLLEPSAMTRCDNDKVTIRTAGVRPWDAAGVFPQVRGDFIENPMWRVPRDEYDLTENEER